MDRQKNTSLRSLKLDQLQVELCFTHKVAGNDEMPVEIERLQQHELESAAALEPRGRVIVHNDPITPYDFVTLVLVRFFKLDAHQAELVTWTAHTSGQALVVVLPLKEAADKVSKAHFAATLEGFPLMFTVEPVESS